MTRMVMTSSQASGEKDIDVEGDGERCGANIEDRRIDMMGVGPHQDRSAHRSRIENRAAVKPSNGRRADEALSSPRSAQNSDRSGAKGRSDPEAR